MFGRLDINLYFYIIAFYEQYLADPEYPYVLLRVGIHGFYLCHNIQFYISGLGALAYPITPSHGCTQKCISQRVQIGTVLYITLCYNMPFKHVFKGGGYLFLKNFGDQIRLDPFTTQCGQMLSVLWFPQYPTIYHFLPRYA